MSSILSSLSGHFTKSLMMGVLLPVLLFIILFWLLVTPFFPYDWKVLKALESFDDKWQIVAISLITIAFSGLLYNLNIPIIRLYEGYPWRDTWIGQWCIKRMQANFDAAHVRWTGMRTLLRCMKKTDTGYEEIRGKWDEVGMQINTEFPRQRSSVLPTRLGNVIRSFESYPYKHYRIAAITVWPRLIAKIDKDYAASIDDAKTALDFMLNSSLLSAILALAILIAGLIFPVNWTSRYSLILWIFQILVFSIMSYFLYIAAIGRAGSWGDMVKGAFDLYRWQLLDQLGYKEKPLSMEDERDLWDSISLRMIFGDLPRFALAQYTSLSTSARGSPPTADLKVRRGINAPDANGIIKVNIYVQNADSEHRPVQNLIIKDTLPEGFEYEWDSALCDDNPIAVTGVNPYSFELGTLEFDKEATLSYRMIPRKKN